MKAPSIPLRPIAIFMGLILAGLIAADYFMEVNEQTFGFGTSTRVEAESGMAVFFLGLILGVLLGVAVFFAHIVRREQRQQAEQQELSMLLDEVSRDDTVFDMDDWMSNNEMPEFKEDNTHPLDPWERGADWWKSDGNSK